MKKYNNKKYKYPKYAMGGFGPKGQSTAQGVAGMASMFAPMLGEGSRGAGALSGAASGAGMGAALGPPGMIAGALLGGTMGLISAGNAKRKEEAAINQGNIDASNAYGKQFNSQLDTNNQNAYGIQTFKKGGIVKYPDGSDVEPYPKPGENNIPFNSKINLLNPFTNQMASDGSPMIYMTKRGNELSQKQWLDNQSSKMPYSDKESMINRIDGYAVPLEKNVVQVAGKAFQNTPKAINNNYKETQGISNQMGGGYSTYPISAAQNRATDSTSFVKQYRLDNQIAKTSKYAEGSDVQNQENMINIEKGELQIDPQSGKILRHYAGINPETGGMYEAHSKKGKDTKHNIVEAQENTFIITKAKAAEYKNAVDNNDKLHLESIKMNIRNNKDAKMGTYKMGSYVKYADGGDSPFDNQNDLRYFQRQNGLTDDGIYGNNTKNAYNTFIQNSGQSFNNSAGLNITNPIGKINTVSKGYTSPSFNPKMQTPLGTQSVNTGAGDAYQAKQQQGNDFLNTAMQYAPSLMNIGQGMFGKVEQEKRVQAQINPFQNEVLNNMPEDVSYQPMVNELNKGLRGQFNRIDNTTSGSAIGRANKNSLYSDYQDKLGNIRMQNEIANNQVAQQKGATYNQLGQQQVNSNLAAEGMNFQIDQINAQNRGVKQNMLNAGIGQMQQTYQNNKANNAKGYMDKSRINMLKQMFPNTKFYDGFDYDKFYAGLKNFKG